MERDDRLETGFIEIRSEVSHRTQAGTRYCVHHNGKILIKSARDPLTEAARELWLDGAACDDILILADMNGRELVSGRVGMLAATQIMESDTVSIRAAQWVPYFGPGSDA